MFGGALKSLPLLQPTAICLSLLRDLESSAGQEHAALYGSFLLRTDLISLCICLYMLGACLYLLGTYLFLSSWVGMGLSLAGP